MATPSQKSIDTLLANPDADAQREFADYFGEDALAQHMPEGSYAAGVARSVGQGLTFGFADELTAGAKALFSKDSYSDLLDEERRALHKFREDNPEAYAYEIGAGMLIPGVGLAKGAATAGKLALTTGKVGQAAKAGREAQKVRAAQPLTGRRAAGVGASQGALYGAGAAEGGLGERAVGAGIGAAIGAPLGAVAGKAADVYGRFKTRGLAKEDRSASRAARRIMGKAHRDIGTDEAQVLAAQGRAPTEAYRQTLEEMGPEAVLADVVGKRGERFAAGITHGSDEAGAIAEDVVVPRAVAAYDRVTKDAETLMTARADADRLADVLNRRAQSKAKPLYREAETGEGSVLNKQDFMDFFVDNSDDFRRAYTKAAKIARREGHPLDEWSEFIKRDKEGYFEIPEVGIKLMQKLKQGLDDMVETGRKPTSNIGNAELNSLKQLRSEFSARLGEMNPAYAAANQVRSVGYKIQDAVDVGKQVRKLDARQFLAEFRKLKTPVEQTAFRSGMLQEFKKMGKLESSSLAHKIRNDRDIMAKLKGTFPDDASFKQFLKTLDTEMTFKKTLQNVTGGSRTARTGTSADEAFGLSPEGAAESMFNIASGHGAGQEAARGAKTMMQMVTRFRNRKLGDEAAKLLFSPPGEALMQLDRMQRIYTNLNKADVKLLNDIRRHLLGGATRIAGIGAGELGP